MKLDSLLKAEKGLDTVFTKLLTSGSHLWHLAWAHICSWRSCKILRIKLTSST